MEGRRAAGEVSIIFRESAPVSGSGGVPHRGFEESKNTTLK